VRRAELLTVEGQFEMVVKRPLKIHCINSLRRAAEAPEGMEIYLVFIGLAEAVAAKVWPPR
jgi:hypothetical protein